VATVPDAVQSAAYLAISQREVRTPPGGRARKAVRGLVNQDGHCEQAAQREAGEPFYRRHGHGGDRGLVPVPWEWHPMTSPPAEAGKARLLVGDSGRSPIDEARPRLGSRMFSAGFFEQL